MRKIYIKLTAAIFCATIMLNVLPSCNHKAESKYEKVEGEEAEDENEAYDSPELAAQFEAKRIRDPFTGEIHNDILWNAVLQTEAIKNSVANSTSSTNSLTPLVWTERGSNSDFVGPSNGNSRPGNGVTSGRIKAVWVDKADVTGKTVWIGGVNGGIWKTNDISVTTPLWNNVNDYLSNLVVTGICQDPTNTNTMYFCTGESALISGTAFGNGVFKSTDHGVTWNQLASTTSVTNNTKILCDGAGNIYLSSVGISVAFGLQRSTDGGNTWVSINPFTTAATPTSRVPDFEISSTGVMHIIGGVNNSAAGIGGYRYTANPGTCSTTTGWSSAVTPYTISTGNGSRTELAVAGSTVYVSSSIANKVSTISKSTDGGANWVDYPLTAANITQLNGATGQGTYSNTIGVDPSDPNTVIVGSLNLLKSTDGGVSFSKISEWVGTTGQYCHADQHEITWYDNGNKLLIASDGGMFYSSNKGTNISDKNTSLRLKQFYGVSIHPTSTNYFLCGAQDNGTHQFNNPGLSSSVEVTGGDGGITSIDLDEPQFQTATYVYANFRRSSNSGASWISNGSASTAGQFIDPYDFDNSNNKIYAGGAAGQFIRWEDPHTGFTLTTVPISDFGTGSPSAVTISSSPNTVYFGLDNSRIVRVDNANQATLTSTIITPAGIPTPSTTVPTGYINCVTEGNTSNQNLIATLTNISTTPYPHIWCSTNGGTSWLDCDGNLPNMPVYWAVYHPDSDTKVYIATETGVWSTDLLNGAATIWTPENTFPTVKTSMLKIRASDRTIAAATYGRGLWTATIPSACAQATITTQPIATNVCAGSDATFTVAATGFAPLTYQWQVSTTGAGGTFNNIGTNSATLTLTGVSAAMNNNVYHCVVTNTCPSTATSANVVLTVQAAPTISTQPSALSTCAGSAASFTVVASNTTNYQWQSASSCAGTFTNIAGATSATYNIPATTIGQNGTAYRVVLSNATCPTLNSNCVLLTVNAAPAAPTVANITYCQNNAAVPLTATGTSLLWYTTATGLPTGTTTAPTPSTTTLGSITYYVSQTVSGCESPRSAITVTVVASTPAPVVISPVTYCQNTTAFSLSTSVLASPTANLLWYTTASGGPAGSATAPIPSTAAVGSITYYVSEITSCGEGPRSAITVNVNAIPAAPSVTASIIYCQAATASALTATGVVGSSIIWYGTNATGGTGSATATIPSTASTGTVNYYVSQTVNGCESPRAIIAVTVNATPPAPTVTSPVAYCQGATASALSATGTNLKWYTSLASTTPISTPTPSTLAGGSTTYYVSSTVGICEGPRAAIVVNVTPTPLAPGVTSTVIYCQNTTAIPLTATGTNLLWYTVPAAGTSSATAPTPSTTSLGNTIYYVSQSTNGCEGPRAAITVSVVASTPAPIVPAPITYCQNATAVALTASGTGLLWYTTSTGGTGTATAIIPSTTTSGTFLYYVSQTTSCGEGPRATITVNITALPAAPSATSPVVYCQGVTATALSASGTGLLWYGTNATGGTGSSSAPTPITTTSGSSTYYVSQTASTCEGPRLGIVVNVTALPAAPIVSTPITYCQNATATALTATGTNLKWYNAANVLLAGAPLPITTTIGSTTYFVSQSTGTCEGPKATIVVTVTTQTVAPTVTAVTYCQNATATALTATGTGLLWYGTNATGGTGTTTAPTPSTTATGTTTYYISQTGTCESPRAAINVTVNPTPAAPIVTTPVAFCQGGTATALTATGTGLLWYGTNATGGTGVTTATIPSISTAGTSTYYVSQTTGVCEGPRAAIVVNVGAAPAITTQPVDITSCATSATFTVTATGALLTYQWQVSTDAGANYTNILAANAASLSLNGLTAAQSNFKYRVIISSVSCPSATSNAVSVRVGITPLVILTATPSVNFNPSTNGGLFTSVTPSNASYSYTWKRNNNTIANTTSSLTKANGLLDDFGTYIVTVTDNVTGCVGVSNAITVNDIETERNQLFVSPNPTQGTVKVSYYSDNTASQSRKISVYDAKGALVLNKEFTVTGRYGTVDISLARFANGTYSIVLRDAAGKKLVSKNVLKY